MHRILDFLYSKAFMNIEHVSADALLYTIKSRWFVKLIHNSSVASSRRAINWLEV